MVFYHVQTADFQHLQAHLCVEVTCITPQVLENTFCKAVETLCQAKILTYGQQCKIQCLRFINEYTSVLNTDALYVWQKNVYKMRLLVIL
jgi:hypothetical protein